VLTLTDGRLGEGNFITQSLLLLVEDINDNVPIFRPHPTSLTLREDSRPGILITVEATDADLGAHGQVVYYLQELDGDNNVFNISTVNGRGVIRLVGPLDYERKYLYQLRILAVDRAINEKVRSVKRPSRQIRHQMCQSRMDANVSFSLWSNVPYEREPWISWRS